MSGHNKWSKVKNVKGKEDAKRAQAFTKISRMIMVAVREGGSDPAYNSSLKMAIDKAKAENMPNDNINRAIKKAAGQGDNKDFVSLNYEGYGPAGVAIIVSCLTDNKNRTAANLRHYFDKFGGNLGTDGSVTFQFDFKGLLSIEAGDLDEDLIMMDALEAGAEDVRKEGESYLIISDPAAFQEVHEGLSQKGYEFRMAQTGYLPKNTVSVSDSGQLSRLDQLIDSLEEDDDVQDVYSNLD